MIRNDIDKTLYNWKPVELVNGIPWPRLPKDIPSKVPLKKEYLFRSMDYLDTPQAEPIFKAQADIILKHQYKGIIDVGCRHGPVNDLLYEANYHSYNYMGFDTSPEPIKYATDVWDRSDNIEYRLASWSDNTIDVDFKVDCIIWSGVLLYEEDNHMELFERLHKLYDCNNAIIQEPCLSQRPEHWNDKLTLNTIEEELYLYKNKYKRYEDVVVDCKIFSGRRRIVDLTLE